jgi:hypothetical protein
MNIRKCAAAALVFCMLSACGGGGNEPAAPQPLEFSVLDSAGNGHIQTARFTTVRSEADWQSLWAEYKGPFGIPAPTVNFQSQMVVGVFVGSRPSGCFDAAIRRVIQEAGAVRVEYNEGVLESAPSGTLTSCTTAFTYPAVVAAVARSDLPVSFLKVAQ